MTTNHDVDRQLRSWLAAEAPSHEPAALFGSIATTSAKVRQRPGVLVAVRGGGLVARRTRRFGLALALTALVILFVTAIVAGSQPSTPAPVPPGIFSPAGEMSAPRQGHTATLLADGRVVVIGGLTYTNDGSVNVPAVEAWDRATQSFSSDGFMRAGLVGHTATLLDDGRILVIGGSANEGIGGSAALIWDPGTASSVPTGSMSTARSGHTATRLSDGRVLVIGGASDGRLAQSAEIWDPAAGAFTPTGAPSAGRTGHTATLLSDDRVLVIGGGDTYSRTYVGLTSSEIWDPTSDAFTPTGSLAVGRADHSATLLDDGRVLVVGGGDAPSEGTALRAAETWDPKTGTFSLTAATAYGHAAHTSTLLGDGRVLVAGGGGYFAGAALAETELWDPETDTFTEAASMIDGRASHTATLLDDGRVLVLGGAGQPYGRCSGGEDRCFASKSMRVALSTADIYEPGG